MANARRASTAAGEGACSMSNAGTMSTLIGDVRDLMPKEDDESEEGKERKKKKEGGADGVGAGENASGSASSAAASLAGSASATGKAAGGATAVAKKKTFWFERDEKVMGELKKLREYGQATMKELNDMKYKCEAVRHSIPGDLEEAVSAEKNLLLNRLRAIKLVLADPIQDQHVVFTRSFRDETS